MVARVMTLVSVTEHAVALIVAAMVAPLLWHFGSEYLTGAAARSSKKEGLQSQAAFVPAR